MQTIQKVLEVAEAVYQYAEISGDGMGVIARGATYPDDVVFIPSPDYSTALDAEVRPHVLNFGECVNGARIYKHYKKRLWVATKNDWTSVFIHEPKAEDIL